MDKMSNRGFVSGFIGVGIHMTIQHILQLIHIAKRCKKELADLKELVMSIELTIMHIQQNRMAFKSNEASETASDVNRWLNELDALLLDASKMVQRCSIPKSHVNFSGRQSKKICSLNKDIREHLKLSPLLVRIPEEDTQEDKVKVRDTQKVLEGLGKTKDSLEPLASSATTSQAAMKNLVVGQNQAFQSLSKSAEAVEDFWNFRGKKKLIEEPEIDRGKKKLIEEQEEALTNLENLVIEDAKRKTIVVVDPCGSGKSLILETLFNREKVRRHFSNGLLLWLSLSQRPSVTSVMNDLCKQIAVQKKIEIRVEQDKKVWLKEQLQQSSSFALFLDDVWGRHARNLVRDLGIVGAVADHMSSKLIVSSMDPAALLEMGVAEEDKIKIQDLISEEDSWKLFKHHAFPYHDGNLPSNIDEQKAKRVCNKCAGLPLAIKAVAGAMVSSTHPQQWEWALHRLENAQADRLDDFLRLSFDALGNDDVNMQLCFQHVAAAFPEDEIIDAQEVIPLWMGEGLLARKMLQHVPQHILADRCLIEPMIRNTEGRPVCLRMQDPFQIGRIYLDLLAERCLIEPTARDADGLVLCFRILNVVRDWAIPIAQDEENFYCCVLKNKNESSKIKQLFRRGNDWAMPIAQDEENFYCCVGNGNGLNPLQNNNESSKIKRLFLRGNDLNESSNRGNDLNESSKIKRLFLRGNDLNESSKIKRLFLRGNDLSSRQQFSSYKEMRSLLISRDTGLQKIPMKLIGNMRSLKVLDLSGTSASSLPKQVGLLKELICLKLSGTQIKELPKSVTGLGHLEILDVSFSKIKELPSDIHMLRSLRYLGLRECKNLQNLPCSISGLLSLQYLYMDGCSMWRKPSRTRCKNVMDGCRKVASLQSLGDLIQLKQLALQSDWEQLEQLDLQNDREKVEQSALLKSMTEMDTLLLVHPEMVSLPLHIRDMSKLRSLTLKCSKLINMDSFICSSLTETEVEIKNDVTHLKHLSYLKFYECAVLKDFQHLHKLPYLRQLEIILCPEVKNFPKKFGEKEAFPSLKTFSLVGLQKLQGLPEIKEGAMPSLQIFTVMDCPQFKMSSLNLGSRTKIRVRGCPEGAESIHTKQVIEQYLEGHQKKEKWLYGECWCNEFLQSIQF